MLGGKIFCDYAFEKNAMRKCPLTKVPFVENVFWQIMSLKIMPSLKMPGQQKCPYYKWSSDQNANMTKMTSKIIPIFIMPPNGKCHTEKMPFVLNNLITQSNLTIPNPT